MSFTKKSNNLFLSLFMLAVSAGLLGFAFLGYHDAQIAQGAGLYISIQCNASDRKMYDILMDCIGILLLLFSTLLPPLLLKKFTSASLLRFICLFLAFIPMINPGSLVHIFSQFSHCELRTLGTLNSLLYGFDAFSSLLLLELPLLLLLLAISPKGKLFYQKVLFVLSLVSCLLYFLFPSFGEYTMFFSHYFILILIYDKTESLLKEWSKPQWPIFSLYLLCALKGIYRIILLLQTTHI